MATETSSGSEPASHGSPAGLGPLPPKRPHSPSQPKSPVAKKKKEEDDSIYTRTGGAYIPPARLRMLQEQIKDKTSASYQRMAWEALKKSINGLINKVNVSNITDIVRELFQENIVRGRGLLARSVLTAQAASPTFSHVYAALVAIINTKFPQTGELIAKRLIIQFRKSFRRNDKHTCLCSVRFIAHLINQQVIHELLALELLTVLLENPTSDSVEVGIGFLKECGMKLTELSPKGVIGVFETLKSILHDGNVDIRVQYMIEVMFAIRKDSFKEHPSLVEGLDLIQDDDQITHLLSLDDEVQGEDAINVFKYDPDYEQNEERYRAIKEEILGEGSSDSDEESGDTDESEEEEGQEGEGEMTIVDETQTDLLGLRRTIYLTLMSSLDFEECAHKLIKMELKPGQETEVANMIIECCSQERSYQRYYGLLGERFCHLEQKWVENFDLAFQQQYATVHRLETNKLRNVAKFFAQLFYTDALPWTSLCCIHLNEDETNSSSRIFVKIVFQELAEYMGLPKLNERLKDPFLSEAFEGILPRDNPRNTRFAINFFTSIGLGGLTDDLREHLKNAPKLIMAQEQDVSSDSDSSSSGSDSDSSDDSSNSSESSSSEDERRKRRQKKKQKDTTSGRSRDKKHKRRSESEEETGQRVKRRNGRKESSDSEEDERRERRKKERDHDKDGGDKKRHERGKRDRQSRDRDSRKDRGNQSGSTDLRDKEKGQKDKDKRDRRRRSRSEDDTTKRKEKRDDEHRARRSVSADKIETKKKEKKERSRRERSSSIDRAKRRQKRSRDDRQRRESRSDSEDKKKRSDRYNGERQRRRRDSSSDSDGKRRRDDKRDRYHSDRQRNRDLERESKRRKRDHS